MSDGTVSNHKVSQLLQCASPCEYTHRLGRGLWRSFVFTTRFLGRCQMLPTNGTAETGLACWCAVQRARSGEQRYMPFYYQTPQQGQGPHIDDSIGFKGNLHQLQRNPQRAISYSAPEAVGLQVLERLLITSVMPGCSARSVLVVQDGLEGWLNIRVATTGHPDMGRDGRRNWSCGCGSCARRSSRPHAAKDNSKNAGSPQHPM